MRRASTRGVSEVIGAVALILATLAALSLALYFFTARANLQSLGVLSQFRYAQLSVGEQTYVVYYLRFGGISYYYVVDVGDYPLYLAQRQPLLGVNVTVHGFTHQGQESNASSETFYVNGRPVTTWVVQPKQLYLIQVPGLNQPNVTLITVLPTGKTGVYSTVTLVPELNP